MGRRLPMQLFCPEAVLPPYLFPLYLSRTYNINHWRILIIFSHNASQDIVESTEISIFIAYTNSFNSFSIVM